MLTENGNAHTVQQDLRLSAVERHGPAYRRDRNIRRTDQGARCMMLIPFMISLLVAKAHPLQLRRTTPDNFLINCLLSYVRDFFTEAHEVQHEFHNKSASDFKAHKTHD